FYPPKDANLELLLMPGGYVQTREGGLTLGVMSGVNSDRDESTRTLGLASEPSTCVPARPTPQLSTPPWRLPSNPPRRDYILAVADGFSGVVEPRDAQGRIPDVEIGISRTFLDLFGFHLYSSGALCLSVDGASVSGLSAGTLSVIASSLSNLVDN